MQSSFNILFSEIELGRFTILEMYFNKQMMLPGIFHNSLYIDLIKLIVQNDIIALGISLHSIIFTLRNSILNFPRTKHILSSLLISIYSLTQ